MAGEKKSRATGSGKANRMRLSSNKCIGGGPRHGSTGEAKGMTEEARRFIVPERENIRGGSDPVSGNNKTFSRNVLMAVAQYEIDPRRVV